MSTRSSDLVLPLALSAESMLLCHPCLNSILPVYFGKWGQEEKMYYLKTPRPKEPGSESAISGTVTRIIEDIRLEGFDAFARYSKMLDGYSGPLVVPSGDLIEAEAAISDRLADALGKASANIRTFHSSQKQLFTGFECSILAGVNAGLRFRPVNSAAVYIPGGRYPLPSTALMGVIAAQEAGVNRIVAITPPAGEAGPHSIILGTLSILGIREVWAAGGAQAVAAAAFGFAGAEPVDMIAGPGNAFVTEAKRLLFGSLGIDGLAGPSEVLIISDGSALPDYLAADLLAQAEHDPMARSTLLCTDPLIAESALLCLEDMLKGELSSDIARKSWKENGSILVCSLEEAVEISNRESPEHLVLAVHDPRQLLSECHSFGSAFLGNFSAQSFGDYVAGTNHILPTGKSARFSGGVWTGSFMRAQTYAEIDRRGAAVLAATGAMIAEAEGLPAHRFAMLKRLEGNTN
jgi:histidinol dehydrogenase/sulfopropanediol 3-dehydrogenase